MMGSSQTEGLYVNEDDCVSYLLNEKYAEDGSNRYVYNVGMSAHTIYRNISNLENALKVYRPAEYVALETGTLAMNPVEAAQALNQMCIRDRSYKGGACTESRACIYGSRQSRKEAATGIHSDTE